MIEEQIAQYIQSELLTDAHVALADDTRILADGLLDSTSILELILWIEDTYNFSVENEDMTEENFGTIGRLGAYVRMRLGADRQG